MNARVNPIAWLGICALMTAVAGSASAQWHYGTFVNGDRVATPKTVTLTSPDNKFTNFRWELKTFMDTFAKDDGKPHDPPPFRDAIEENLTTGGPMQVLQEAKIGGSRALVGAAFEVAGSFASGTVVGKVGVAGVGTLGKHPAAAEGSSSSELKLQWTKETANGKIRAQSKWVVAKDAGASAGGERSRYTDPIDLRIFDRTRDTLLIDGRVLETNCWTTDGIAVMDRGTFSTSGLGSGAVFITAGHQLLGGVSRITLTWDNGLITSSFDDGMFDGVLPSIGMSSLGSLFHIGDADGNLDIDITLGDSTAAGYDWLLGLGSSGEGASKSVPAPAGSLALSVLGLWASRRRR